MHLPKIEALDLRPGHQGWWAEQKRTKSIEERANFRLGVWEHAIPTLWDHPDKEKQAIRNSARLQAFISRRNWKKCPTYEI